MTLRGSLYIMTFVCLVLMRPQDTDLENLLNILLTVVCEYEETILEKDHKVNINVYV